MNIIGLKVGETRRLEFPNPKKSSFTVDTDADDVVKVAKNSTCDPAWVDITCKQPGDSIVTVWAGNEAHPVWEELVMVRA